MPDPGRAGPEQYVMHLATPAEYPPLPWRCADATMLSASFEVYKDPLLDRLPHAFNRTSPAYCRLLVIDHPQSPVGPFREATLALGCRLRMHPGIFVVASLTDHPQVLAAGAHERGFPMGLGTIELAVGSDQARATIADETGPLLTLVIPALQTIEPGRLAYDHANALRTTGYNGGARAELVVVAPEIEIARAAISKSARFAYPALRDTVWHVLRSRNMISAQVVHGARTFAAARKLGAEESDGRAQSQKGGSMATYTTLQEVFAGMPNTFNKDAAKGLTAVYQFDLSGEKAGQYQLIIENETCTVKEGKHPAPNITISMAGQDYLDMANGVLNPMTAFMSGKLKVAGDMGLAMKMQSLFPR